MRPQRSPQKINQASLQGGLNRNISLQATTRDLKNRQRLIKRMQANIEIYTDKENLIISSTLAEVERTSNNWEVSDESREMATNIMATSTTKLTHY